MITFISTNQWAVNEIMPFPLEIGTEYNTPATYHKPYMNIYHTQTNMYFESISLYQPPKICDAYVAASIFDVMDSTKIYIDVTNFRQHCTKVGQGNHSYHSQDATLTSAKSQEEATYVTAHSYMCYDEGTCTNVHQDMVPGSLGYLPRCSAHRATPARPQGGG